MGGIAFLNFLVNENKDKVFIVVINQQVVFVHPMLPNYRNQKNHYQEKVVTQVDFVTCRKGYVKTVVHGDNLPISIIEIVMHD